MLQKSLGEGTCGRVPSMSETSMEARMKFGCAKGTFSKHGRAYCGLSGLQLRVVFDANETMDGALPSMSLVSKKLGR